MAQSVSVEQILPLVAELTAPERTRLIRLIVEQPGADDASAYDAKPPRLDEFGSEEEPLEWDAEGWENACGFES